MGYRINGPLKAGPNLETGDMNLSTGWVWIVLREDDDLKQTHLQGVFDDKTKAAEACHDKSYLAGPVPLNTSLPRDRMEWVGSFFPCREQE